MVVGEGGILSKEREEENLQGFLGRAQGEEGIFPDDWANCLPGNR